MPDVKNVVHNWVEVEGVAHTPLPNPYVYGESDVVDVPHGGIVTLSVEWITKASVKVYGVAGFAQDLGGVIYVPGWQGCVPGERGRCGNQYCGFGMDHCRHAGNPAQAARFSFSSTTSKARIDWCFANEADITRQAFFKFIATFEGESGGVPHKPEDWIGPELPIEVRALNFGLSTRLYAGKRLLRHNLEGNISKNPPSDEAP